ncbi:MAG: hypothetical protein GKS03_08375 [Alphaproteobacteria bacterium]|nr:hypothetical protein [Alphaproteobacteria bacterium]
MTSSSPHIVCFAPYTDWSIHSAQQVTVLHGLRLRGATVSYVTCDGVFSDCDLFQKATGAAQGRQPNSCLICQSSVAARLAAWNMPYRWLGTWLTTQDRTDVGRWIANLSPENYLSASLNGWAIGEWVQSSVRTELRCNVFDMEDPKTSSTYASYLYSGALAALGLDRLFEEEKPDAQLLFNGRMAPTRIALELAKQRGIRTLCEERSAVAGNLILFNNVNCLDVDHVDQLWDEWKDIPLTPDEFQHIANVLEERRSGAGGDVSVFGASRQAISEVSNALSLDQNKPLWVLFTSSEDEIADKAGISSIFPTQTGWIEETVKYAGSHQDIQLVIRVHPNVGGNKALGDNTEGMAYFEALATSAPDNVRVVQPGDTLSSYSLAEMCDLALVWYSTIAIETATLGRRVIRAGGFLLENRDFIYAPESPPAYPGLLDQMREEATTEELLEIAVGAWRFAYIWYLRRTIPFPLVAQPEWYVGEMAWNNPQELVPGSDSSLDRICEIFMSGSPVHKTLDGHAPGSKIEEQKLVLEHIRPFLKESITA